MGVFELLQVLSTMLVVKDGCGLTWRPTTKHQTAARSPLPFPCSRMGRREGQKGKLKG